MNEVKFTVPGKPVAKGRPRAFIRNGHVATYTPEKTVSYENLVKTSAYQAMRGAQPIQDAVGLNISVLLEIPASWSKAKQLQAINGELRPSSKPDLDNILKALADGMNGVVYADDSQIVSCSISKWYAATTGVQIVARVVAKGSRKSTNGKAGSSN